MLTIKPLGRKTNLRHADGQDAETGGRREFEFHARMISRTEALVHFLGSVAILVVAAG
ncbi:hypothetical protein ACFU9B_41070 [Streptomyces sp. NPDC057592]|uniref:hypothetical protein n=1 Tax=unclassified Streptomyces TaxID=2593676 RepID=UPI0036781587